MKSLAPSSDAVIVVGTGIVGLATALGLARRGQRPTLLGPRAELAPAVPDRHDPRVYALSPASRQWLQELGVWDALPASRITAVQAMEIHGDAGGRVDLSAWQAGTDTLAWIVESTELERALRQALQVFGVPWTRERFDHLTRQPGTHAPVLVTDRGTALPAALAVAADGAGSALREAAGVAVQRTEYDATGVVVHLNAELPHQGTACQWFTPHGVLALLPMPDTADGPQVSMVWSLKRALADTLLALPAEAQAARLQQDLAQATGGRVGALTPRSPLHGFPLALQRSQTLMADGIALVGDAAHLVHPLAGQGLNLGLGDAQTLAQIVAERESFRPAGDERVLRRYQRARAEPVAAMRLATDSLYHLFNHPAAPLAWLRNTGMRLVDNAPFVKRLLVGRASLF